jgi:eukaryotic-like serine/threonine-protein kinase
MDVATPDEPVRPVDRLLGMTLDGGWKVIERFEHPVSDATGGNNSVGFIVENAQGQRGFLKAIDLASATKFNDPPSVLQEMLSAYLNERNICTVCKDKQMRRVAVAIAHGQVEIDSSLGVGGSVPYIIFELADGDIRHAIDKAAHIDAAWSLGALKDMAAGMDQLHRAEIAHLDTKPSNALTFSNEGIKLSDFGRSVQRGRASLHENDVMVGDPSYAPPELHYDYLSSDWNERRYGCDLYLLGSMAVFLFSRTTMTGLLSAELAGIHHWRQWRGGYAEVLPYVREGFGRAIIKFEGTVTEVIRPQLVTIVRQLCEPDPSRRGHPTNMFQSGNNKNSIYRFLVERYVSQFNALAKRCELVL